jgi:uncharacterized protein
MHLFIIIEFLALFIALPLLYWLDLIPFHKIIPLVLLFVYCVSVLVAHKKIGRNKFGLAADWKVILIRFGVMALLIFGLLTFSSSYPLFADLEENRKLVLMLMLYPLLSALPQELIFRQFFFYRYAGLFQNPKVLIIVNVVIFSFAHIYFSNWIVVAVTLAGGLIFAITFLKTRSLLVVTIEHTLYGLMILSSGLSIHFYKAF